MDSQRVAALAPFKFLSEMFLLGVFSFPTPLHVSENSMETHFTVHCLHGVFYHVMLLKINILLFFAELQTKHEQEKAELTKRFQAAEEILKVTVLIQKA